MNVIRAKVFETELKKTWLEIPGVLECECSSLGEAIERTYDAVEALHGRAVKSVEFNLGESFKEMVLTLE